MPRVFPAGPRPSVPKNVNEQTYVDVTFSATESTDTTTDLSRASFKLFAG
jgi:hypothetical protein